MFHFSLNSTSHNSPQQSVNEIFWCFNDGKNFKILNIISKLSDLKTIKTGKKFAVLKENAYFKGQCFQFCYKDENNQLQGLKYFSIHKNGKIYHFQNFNHPNYACYRLQIFKNDMLLKEHYFKLNEKFNDKYANAKALKKILNILTKI